MRLVRSSAAAVLTASALAGVAGHDSARSAASAQTCHYRLQGALPDPNCTPGATNPDVTPRRINKTICVKGWTDTIRPDSLDRMKRDSMAEYGARGKPGAYEYDHLISLQLGGHPSDPHNLWSEPYDVKGDNNDLDARDKDVVETRLKRLVCAGQMKLREARRIIAIDWRAGPAPLTVRSRRGSQAPPLRSPNAPAIPSPPTPARPRARV